jgi:hypothetical protein
MKETPDWMEWQDDAFGDGEHLFNEDHRVLSIHECPGGWYVFVCDEKMCNANVLEESTFGTVAEAKKFVTDYFAKENE